MLAGSQVNIPYRKNNRFIMGTYHNQYESGCDAIQESEAAETKKALPCDHQKAVRSAV